MWYLNLNFQIDIFDFDLSNNLIYISHKFFFVYCYKINNFLRNMYNLIKFRHIKNLNLKNNPLCILYNKIYRQSYHIPSNSNHNNFLSIYFNNWHNLHDIIHIRSLCIFYIIYNLVLITNRSVLWFYLIVCIIALINRTTNLKYINCNAKNYCIKYNLL